MVAAVTATLQAGLFDVLCDDSDARGIQTHWQRLAHAIRTLQCVPAADARASTGVHRVNPADGFERIMGSGLALQARCTQVAFVAHECNGPPADASADVSAVPLGPVRLRTGQPVRDAVLCHMVHRMQTQARRLANETGHRMELVRAHPPVVVLVLASLSAEPLPRVCYIPAIQVRSRLRPLRHS